MPEGDDAAEDGHSADPFRLIRRFLAVRFAISAAMQTQAVALGWYVFALTDSAFDLGLIGLVQFLPFVALALPAGQLLDRHSRRYIVAAALAVETLCSLTLALLALSGAGGAGLVFLAVACYGAARAFENPAMQSWLPSLVPAPALPRASAWASLSNQSAVVLGPALGGLLYLLGPSVPFFFAAAMPCLAVAAVLRLPVPHRAVREKLSWGTFLGGVHFIWRNEVVRGAISLDLFCVLFGGAIALLPIYARDILAVGPAGLGVLRSAPALGACIAGYILTRRPTQRRVGRRMMIAVAGFGVATLVFGLSRNFALSVLALAAIGAADTMSGVIRSTMMLVASPDAVRGRVIAIDSLFGAGSGQLGQFRSGVMAAWFGPVGSVVIGGLATIAVAGVWAWRFPALRRMDHYARPEEVVDTPREGVPDSRSELPGRI
jgi:MFS family permease